MVQNEGSQADVQQVDLLASETSGQSAIHNPGIKFLSLVLCSICRSV
jgi:hypothetical protein